LPGGQLQRRLSEAQSRLGALGRLADSLHPEAPLKRGFARVSDSQGRTIFTTETAKSANQVSIRFADGSVNAIVGGEAPRPRPAKTTAQENQTDLFGDGS
jgi:exodeoxyribonuclease VII large subunit